MARGEAKGVRVRLAVVACLAVAIVGASPAISAVRAGPRPSTADSFSLGSGQGDTMCQVQVDSTDPAATGLFDRAYTVVCRDAAAAVGKLYALRPDSGDPFDRVRRERKSAFTCDAGTTATLADAGAVTTTRCQSADGLGYASLSAQRGKTVYIAEGLAGYRSALELGLRTIIADRIIPGSITIATTEAGDPAAFARAQAGSLDLDRALAEGYRRNNGGNYAEAAEFFDTLAHRESGNDRRLGEYLINRALQQSNLGDFDEAAALFAQAEKVPTSDPVELRLRRNYRVIDRLNRGQLDAALNELRRPLTPVSGVITTAVIDADTAAMLNLGGPLARQLGLSDNVTLTPAEKVAILDAQSTALQGTIARLQKRPEEARGAFSSALSQLDLVHHGQVTSVAHLRAQIMDEQAALAEENGDTGAAESLLRGAINLLAAEYPGSITVNAGKARLAAFLARHGQADAALALYREVVTTLGDNGGATSGFASLLEPYFNLLLSQIDKQPALVDDLFIATQTMVRPGVADTQATLARELSAGDGEAARLFRQSLNLTRATEAMQVELARLSAIAKPTAQDRQGIIDDRAQLAALAAQQTETQAKLSAFPRYRAISTRALTLADLRAVLKPGEAYWKLTAVDSSLYALLVTPDQAIAWKVPLTVAALSDKVTALRQTIAVTEAGKLVTYPFDVALARQLYVDLSGPAAGLLPKIGHLIFEPDGAMQQLPITLLVTEQSGVDRYLARIADKSKDEFDMTGVAWLGATDDVSTAVAARAFRDIRQTGASRASRSYIGFGENAPVPPFIQLTAARPLAGPDCSWPFSAWSHPISPRELQIASQAIGAGQSTLVTGAAFTDSDVTSRQDLANYRIIHFATHGLVTAPRAQCPARPALLTSYGSRASDGLLDFREIYDLQLDADLVVLSACDTAGSASVAATREAGVTSGGGNALDGLVRAFVGAGARSVIASHWPAPDDYQATERLITAMFTAPRGTPISEALRQGQRRLMADPNTSHPYYWAGFSVVGDGAQPVLRAN
jgi:CHAT domain-containing protein